MSYQERKDLIENLMDGRPADDPDRKLAESLGFRGQIAELFADCYSGEDLLKWLVEHNFDPFDGLQFAEIVERGEVTAEEWQRLLDDGPLMVNDDETAICVSW